MKERGFVVHGTPTLEEWLDAGKWLSCVRDGVLWWWGDRLIYGEAGYDERHTQALEVGPYKGQTLRDAAYVAKASLCVVDYTNCRGSTTRRSPRSRRLRAESGVARSPGLSGT